MTGAARQVEVKVKPELWQARSASGMSGTTWDIIIMIIMCKKKIKQKRKEIFFYKKMVEK